MNTPFFHSVEPEVKNISLLFQVYAGSHPFKRAVVYPENRDMSGRTAYSHLTFRQLDQESDCMAAGLKDIDVHRGTRVLLATRPGLLHFSLIYALLKTGAVPILVDPDLELSHIRHCIKSSQPEIVIGLPKIQFLKYIYPSSFRSIKTTLSVEGHYFSKGLKLSHIRKIPWARQDPASMTDADTALIIYAADACGTIRCIPFSHGHLVSAARDADACIGSREGDTLLSLIPLFSILGPCLGITTILPRPQGPESRDFDPLNQIESIIDQGVTHWIARPCQTQKTATCIKDSSIRVSSLKRVMSIGQPLYPEHIIATASSFSKNIDVIALYSTDAQTPITYISGREIKDKTRILGEKGYGNCIGRPIDNTGVDLIRITDEQISHWSRDLAVPKGDTGEIVVKQHTSQNILSSFPEFDPLNVIPDGHNIWARTGDLGWMDKKGRIWYCGRKSQRIAMPDTTLFTIPCELILNSHESVARAAVVGVGPKDQKKPVACITLKDDNALDQETIRDELFTLAGWHVITKHLDAILFPEVTDTGRSCSPEPERDKLAKWAEKLIRLNPEAGHKNKSSCPTG